MELRTAACGLTADSGLRIACGLRIRLKKPVMGLALPVLSPAGLAPSARSPQEIRSAHPGPEVAVFGPEGRFLGVAAAADGRLAPLRLMATEASRQAP